MHFTVRKKVFTYVHSNTKTDIILSEVFSVSEKENIRLTSLSTKAG